MQNRICAAIKGKFYVGILYDSSDDPITFAPHIVYREGQEIIVEGYDRGTKANPSASQNWRRLVLAMIHDVTIFSTQFKPELFFSGNVSQYRGEIICSIN